MQVNFHSVPKELQEQMLELLATKDPEVTFPLFQGEHARKGITLFEVEYDKDKIQSAYSDRLHQWDAKKHDRCCQQIWGNSGQYWHERSANEVSKFLTLYNGYPCKVVQIKQYENCSSGYPLWYFLWEKES